MIKTLDKTTRIAIIGLGYVGLPLLIEFSKHHDLIAFDISEETGEVDNKTIAECHAIFTNHEKDLTNIDIFIITVPTPIDSNNTPDLSHLKASSHTVGRHLKKESIVVYESTVYPGATEEVCIPIIEKESKLTFQTDFEIGYSPERISPGEKERTLTKITKVVSASSQETLDILSKLYGNIIPAGIYKASSIKVAEAAKVIENTQRDLNVALMNELSIIFEKMGINTLDVIEAAATKWNFMKMGITFKENVADIRNSKVIDIINELKEYQINVIVSDPMANAKETQDTYDITLKKIETINDIDAIIIATPHSQFKLLSLSEISKKIKRKTKVIMDIKGLFRDSPRRPDELYWTL